MRLLDVNILIYAHREDQKDFEFYRQKLEALVSSGNAFGITPASAGGFIRVCTQTKFPNGPTPLPVALSVIEALMASPMASWVNPGRRHWEIFAELSRKTNCTGKKSADAQHAATAIEHACIWVSRDSDFSSFVPHGLRFECWRPD